jgi:uncharacterized membrane-anchored protein
MALHSPEACDAEGEVLEGAGGGISFIYMYLSHFFYNTFSNQSQPLNRDISHHPTNHSLLIGIFLMAPHSPEARDAEGEVLEVLAAVYHLFICIYLIFATSHFPTNLSPSIGIYRTIQPITASQ